MPGVKGQRSGGHNKKTREQLEIEGTFDPSRHAGLENPLPVQGIPTAPAKLGKVGRKEWRRTLELLDQTRTLSKELAAAVYGYCRLFEEQQNVIAARDERRERMETIEVSLKELHGDALVEAISCLTKLEQLNAKDATQIRQYALGIRTYLVEFGFTPASRGRVKLSPVKRRTAPKDHEPTPLEKLQAAQRKLRAV